MKIVKTDGSYFNRIESHAEWSASGTGFKDWLKDELLNFRVADLDYIQLQFEGGNRGKAYALTMLALTDSIAWIDGYIVLLDYYYTDLAQSKFSTKKVWHVTTCVSR